MAAITLSLLSVSNDGKSITLKATSDGSAPTDLTLKWRYWTETAEIETILSGGQLTSILSSTGLVITPDLVGLTDATGAAFADGVHHVISESIGFDDGDIKVLVNKAAEKFLTEQIGTLAEKDCECREKVVLLNKLLRFRFAADVQHDCSDYDGSHNLVVAIGKSSDDCDCNC
jgi:hypothetical protein